nr:MAG TPA: Succinylbenzoate synthase [Bacteriophage sp.]
MLYIEFAIWDLWSKLVILRVNFNFDGLVGKLVG